MHKTFSATCKSVSNCVEFANKKWKYMNTLGVWMAKEQKNMCMNRMYYVYFFSRKFIAWENIGKVAYEKSFFTIAWVECKYRTNYSFSYSVLMKLAVYRLQHENKVTLHGASWSSFSNYDLVFLSFKKVHIIIIWPEQNGDGTWFYCWICLQIQSQYDDVMWILVYCICLFSNQPHFVFYLVSYMRLCKRFHMHETCYHI